MLNITNIYSLDRLDSRLYSLAPLYAVYGTLHCTALLPSRRAQHTRVIVASQQQLKKRNELSNGTISSVPGIVGFIYYPGWLKMSAAGFHAWPLSLLASMSSEFSVRHQRIKTCTKFHSFF